MRQMSQLLLRNRDSQFLHLKNGPNTSLSVRVIWDHPSSHYIKTATAKRKGERRERRREHFIYARAVKYARKIDRWFSTDDGARETERAKKPWAPTLRVLCSVYERKSGVKRSRTVHRSRSVHSKLCCSKEVAMSQQESHQSRFVAAKFVKRYCEKILSYHSIKIYYKFMKKYYNFIKRYYQFMKDNINWHL